VEMMAKIISVPCFLEVSTAGLAKPKGPDSIEAGIQRLNIAHAERNAAIIVPAPQWSGPSFK